MILQDRLLAAWWGNHFAGYSYFVITFPGSFEGAIMVALIGIPAGLAWGPKKKVKVRVPVNTEPENR